MLQEIDYNESIIEERDSAINHIVQQTQDVAEIMQMLNVLVSESSPLIIQIDDNVK